MREIRRHIAVVGAGVIGACLAMRLAECGTRVTLLDQGSPGGATSRLSFAWLNANEKLPRSYHDLNAAGMRAWAQLGLWLDGASWYRPVGNLRWAGDMGSRMVLRERVRRLRAWGYAARTVTAREVADIEPAVRLPEGIAEAAWFPEEGYVLTEPLIARLVARAQKLGVSVLTGDHGRVVGMAVNERGAGHVRTAAGATVDVDAVVSCTGRWTPEVAALAQAAVPLTSPRGAAAPAFVVRVGPVGWRSAECVVHSPEVNLRRHTDRLVHLEALGAVPSGDPPQGTPRARADELLAKARRIVPGLDTARVVECAVCVRPIPVDGRPVIGRPRGSGLYVVVTHSGVTLAAHLAELVAGEVASGVERSELRPYRPGRFPGPVATR